MTSIRVLTWNVHGCVGSIGRFDPDAVIESLREIAPDIVALQEIDARTHTANDLDTFEYLREKLAWHTVEARTIRTDGGDYGHAIFSPWPIESGCTLDLSVEGFEPRAAVGGEIRKLGVTVYAAHLGLRARERRAQIAKLIAQIERHDCESMIVLGDFNEWRRRGGVASRALSPTFAPAAAMPSFPSWRPFFALDRIWCGAALEPVGARAIRRLARLSDHLPVVADLRHRSSAD
jgi:endonuclease/exonuclease/phosphatase family metal-dependent hydrolase